MQNKKIRIFLSVLATALISFACTVFVGGPEYPPNTIPVSTEAVGNLDLQLQAAKTAAAQSGIMTISVNEMQLTSLLANKLDSQIDPFIQDPQVYLRDNEIQVYGKAKKGNLAANIRLVLIAKIDQDGKPVIEISSADFGPFPVPEELNTYTSAIIDQTLTGALGPAAIGLRLESIAISDGVMTLTGRVK
jgi:hypothetical protein